MKVLHVYKDYFPPVKGGIERNINLLATEQKKRGINVDVLVSNTKAKLETQCIDGINVTKVPQIGRVSSAPLNIGFSFWLKKIGSKVDIVHFHFPNPTGEIAYLCTGLKNKYVVSYHSDIVRQKILGALYTPFRDLFLDGATRIIAASPNYFFSSPVLRKVRNKVRIVPYGVDVDCFDNSRITDEIEKVRKRFGPRIVLFVGRFRYYKGLHVMVNAMRHINANFLIIGNGPLKKDLIKQVKKQNLESKIFFIGGIPDDQMAIYMHACDLLVLPSVFRSEAFGIVLLEAMACGKPIVTTELGTGTSFANLNGRTGLVVPPGKVEALASAVNRILNNRELRHKMGAAARCRVQEMFSIEKMVDGIINVYTECLNCSNIQVTAISKNTEAVVPHSADQSTEKIRVLRVISRLNIGGPAIHVKQLTQGLNPERFETILITGQISKKEGNMGYLFDGAERSPQIVPELQREIDLMRDMLAFWKIFRLLIRENPNILHTHAAKAGMTRLVASFYALVTKRKIKTIHTFHGNVFEGYFSRFKSEIFIQIERFLSKITDCIIAISDSQKIDLYKKYRIAEKERIRKIELGFDLKPFLGCKEIRGRFRKSLGVDDTTLIVGIIGRLVPIKNHLLFIEAAKSLTQRFSRGRIAFVVVGDGELRDELEKHVQRLGLSDCFLFTGWIRNVSGVYADIDILALTSINEGTPVSIIEAMASTVPVVATDAGGVKDLLGSICDRHDSEEIRICERGILCKNNEATAFAKAIEIQIRSSEAERLRRLENAREFVARRYSHERLIQDIESLYFELVGTSYSQIQ